jgi:microcystin-dependent protein
MATVTPGIVWTSGETVTPAKLNSAAAPTVAVADDEITTAKILDANVTLAKLAAVVQNALLPAGAVQAFAMNSAPTGWLSADGTAVSRTDYAALFTAIGTTYGVGDGSTTFALPDLRGIFVRGSGSQTISGAAYAGTFATKQAASEVYNNYSNARVPDVSNGVFNADATSSRSVQVINITNASLSTVSKDYSHIRPANIALLYCIKF